MGIELFANNAHSLVKNGINAVVTSLEIDTGTGGVFPNPTSGDFFRLALVRPDLTTEIAYCTARAGDILTIVRGREGTTAVSFSVGDRVRHRPTAGMLDDIAGLLELDEAARFYGWAGTGPNAGSVKDWGVIYTPLGSQAFEAASTSDMLRSIPGHVYTAATAVQQIGGHYGINQSRLWRGNAANRGGFDSWIRWGLQTELGGTYAYIGIDADNGSYSPPATTPSSRVVEQVGFMYDIGSAAGSNYQLIHSAGGFNTVIDTGIPRTTTNPMAAHFYAPPNASYIDATLYDLQTGAVYFLSVVSNMPPTTVFLEPRCTSYGATGQSIRFYGYWRHDVNQSEFT